VNPPLLGSPEPWPSPRLRALQVAELFRFAGISTAFSFFGAVLTLGVLFEAGSDRAPAVMWFAAATAVAVFRGLVVFFYRRREPRTPIERWPRYVIAGNLAAGVLWGVLGTVLFPQGAAYAQLFTVMVIICFVAGSVTAYAPVRGAHDALSIPATFPTAIYLFFLRDGAHWYAGLAALLFAGAIVYYARQLHAHLERGFQAQIERDDLLSLSQAVQDKIQLENRDLAHRVAVRGARAESALGRAERLEALFERSPLPQLDCDFAGVVIVANPAAERLFGEPHHGMSGKPLAAYLGPAAARALAETAPRNLPAAAKLPDGRQVECVASVTPWAGPDGTRGFGLVLSGLDVRAAVGP
jgi:PAS domain-containing protein